MPPLLRSTFVPVRIGLSLRQPVNMIDTYEGCIKGDSWARKWADAIVSKESYDTNRRHKNVGAESA